MSRSCSTTLCPHKMLEPELERRGRSAVEVAGEVNLPLDTSFWRPAFIVAAAWSDMEARLGEAGGESPGARFGCSVMPDAFGSQMQPSGCAKFRRAASWTKKEVAAVCGSAVQSVYAEN